MLAYASLRAELNGQARTRLFSDGLEKIHGGNKNLFNLPIARARQWVWATHGPPGPCPLQGFGLRF